MIWSWNYWMQNFLAPDSFSDWNKSLVCLNYPPPVSVSLPPSVLRTFTLAILAVRARSAPPWMVRPHFCWRLSLSSSIVINSFGILSCFPFKSKSQYFPTERKVGSCLCLTWATPMTCLGYYQTQTDLTVLTPHTSNVTFCFSSRLCFWWPETWDPRAVLTMNVENWRSSNYNISF